MFFILWQQSCHTRYQVKMHVMDGSRRGKLPLAESYDTALASCSLSEASGNALVRSWVLR